MYRNCCQNAEILKENIIIQTHWEKCIERQEKVSAKWHVLAVMEGELQCREADLRYGVPHNLRCWLTHTLAVVWKWIRSLLPFPRLLLRSLFLSLTVVFTADRTQSYWTHHKAFIKVNTAPLYFGVKHLLACSGIRRKRNQSKISQIEMLAEWSSAR